MTRVGNTSSSRWLPPAASPAEAAPEAVASVPSGDATRWLPATVREQASPSGGDVARWQVPAAAPEPPPAAAPAPRRVRRRTPSTQAARWVAAGDVSPAAA